MININFKKSHKDAILPDMAYNSVQAGIDFYSIEEKIINPQHEEIIRTGLCWEPYFTDFYTENNIQDHFNIYMKLYSKSGLSSNYGIEVGAGVIDQDYRGEIKVVLYNLHTATCYLVNKGSKIAQGVVYILPKIEVITEVEQIAKTERNDKGFGSSG
jgi:deoxyuridine 5'-triphosphate nucleotidohydrolase